MEFSQLFCELSAVSEDIKLVVDKLAQSEFRFNDKDEPKKQILKYFLQILKESKENQDFIQNLSDEYKKKLMQFFGYEMLKTAMSDIEGDREELILPELLGISYDIGNFCKKTIIEESVDVKSSYFGSFYNGIPNGEGIISYCKLGEKIGVYQGIMKDGFPRGEGKMSITINDVTFYYKGLFQQGLPDGKGTPVIDGDTYEGVWNNGVLNCKDGKVIKFTIENGMPNFAVDTVVEKEEKTNHGYFCSFFNFLTIWTKCNPLSVCMQQRAENIGSVRNTKKDEKYL